MESVEQTKGNNAWSLKNNGSEFKAATGPSQRGTQVGIISVETWNTLSFIHMLYMGAHIFFLLFET